MWEDKYAEVSIRVAKYGRVGRGEGADAAAKDGFETKPLIDGSDSSVTM